METKKENFFDRIAHKERKDGIQYTESFKEKLFTAR